MSRGRATLRYGLPQAGPAGVRVFDAAGRCVLWEQRVLERSGVLTVRLPELGAGVYLLRLDAPDYAVTRKLVVQH